MGHIRVGTLPNTPRWGQVVEVLSDEGTSAAAVAGATMQAAERGLQVASHDEGLCYTVWLLSHITLAARRDDLAAALNNIGVFVPHEPSVFDIVGGFSDAMDNHLRQTAGRTDIGEMAQIAATETLARLCTAKSRTLFKTTSTDVKEAIRSFSTKRGFSDLAHDFFSGLTQKYLTYHLGRELSNHVGEGRRFHDPGEHAEFIDRLGTHCRQVALIVKEFAGGWHSKANYEDGISHVKARNFAWAAMKKIRAELSRRGASGVG